MRATYLVAGLCKDARRDPTMFPAEQAYEMATLGGARALLAEHEIGSIEPGKKADLVLHDRDRPEWTPLLNVANQLVWSADGRGVHTVYVDGRKVVDAYRLTTVDELDLYRPRPGRPARRSWPAPGCPTAPSGRSSDPVGATLAYPTEPLNSSGASGVATSSRTRPHDVRGPTFPRLRRADPVERRAEVAHQLGRPSSVSSALVVASESSCTSCSSTSSVRP